MQIYRVSRVKSCEAMAIAKQWSADLPAYYLLKLSIIQPSWAGINWMDN